MTSAQLEVTRTEIPSSRGKATSVLAARRKRKCHDPLLGSLSLLGLCFVVASCTWTRFDDVTDNPPVERFETPSSASSLGLSLAAYQGSSGTQLVASANDRIALYDLGNGIDPSRTATSTQTCSSDNSCTLARNLAALRSEALTGNANCVAYGMGTVAESTGTAAGKLWLYCDDQARHSLDLPPTMQTWLASASLAQAEIYVASPRNMATPALAAAVPQAALAWFYGGSSAAPIELPALPDGKKVGRALAVIPLDATSSSTMIAASSQTTNEVYLYSVNATGTASLDGCLSGPEQFGRLLSTGLPTVSQAGLLVADATAIYAIDGTSLAQAAANGVASCTDVSATINTKASCARIGNIDGCAAQPFAGSITTAKLDVTTEVLVVGAPNATVRGESAAGAVFVYALVDGGFKVTDGLSVSSASSGDRLGTSVTAVPSGAFDRIVAGMPGDNSVVEFFCNSFVPAGASGARCP